MIELVVESHRVLLRRLGSLVVLGSVVVLVVNPVELDFAPFFLVFLVAHEGLVASKWESTLVLAGAVLLMVGVEISGRYDGSFIWILGMVIVWAGGLAICSQLTLVADLEAAQSALAERAVAEERQRIAGEIDDVVAHTLSVTMLYVTGARLAIRRDPKEAEEALLAAERLGRESLQEIRRTVGLLGPDVSGAAAPMPTVADVPDLIDEFRRRRARGRPDAGRRRQRPLAGHGPGDLPDRPGVVDQRREARARSPRRCPPRHRTRGGHRSACATSWSVPRRTATPTGWASEGCSNGWSFWAGRCGPTPRDGEWVVDVDVPVEQAVA